MSNIVPLDTTNVPAHVAARLGKGSAVSDNLSSGVGMSSDFPRISIKSSRFRIVEDGTETVLETTKLETVIVGANPNLSKNYYATAWNPDAEATGPDCFSLNGIAPHPEATSPQHDLCATCPHNAWGSKVTDNGQKTKACADQRRLAVVAADDPTGPIYLLQVTPAALKGLKEYNNDLKRRGVPVEIVKTVLSFDPNASFPKLQFNHNGFLDDATQAQVDARLDEAIIRDITGMDQPDAAAPAAPAAAPAVAAPAPQPEPAPAPAPQPEPEAPKRGFGAAAAAPAAEPAPQPEQVAAPAPAPEPAPVKEEPAAAPVADAATASLADEIAGLIGEVNDDA